MENLFFERDPEKARHANQERIEEAKIYNQERFDQLEEIQDTMYNLDKKEDISFDPDYIDG
ncbi:hypothetical protein [Ammoniphilus sp. YIM 78166]|uniref:hypothetical protein n=1 Tax=Ammoniphilus sp. YIM 78166 TaxID=1644106 RepID=UPI0010700DE0|nr:hypothetical protein [Ammoniphilus sp. YIM 78166]